MGAFIPDTIRGRLVATYVLLFLLLALPLSLYVGSQAFQASRAGPTRDLRAGVRLIAAALRSYFDLDGPERERSPR